MKYNLKVKILFTIVTLTVLCLSVFSLLSYQTYKKDKLAFIYDYMASETQSKSSLISSIIEGQDFYLNSIISQLDLNTKKLHPNTQKFLHSNSNILGIYYHHPGHVTENTLHQSVKVDLKVIWQDLHAKGHGLSLLDQKSSQFLFKKPLMVKGGYAVVIFQSNEILNLLKSGAGRFSFIINEGQLLSKKEIELSKESINNVKESVNKRSSSFGLYEAELDNENYFISYSKLTYNGMILISLVKSQKVLLIQDIFVKQLIIFLVLMVSISIFIGTISSNWITLHLDDLTQAATEMEKENFDYVVPVRSKDEFGLLGDSFNSMSSKIRSLLGELRRYNTELEQMVEDRTKELQTLTGIQRAMLNSLGQGFVIVNSEGRVLPIYSKVALEMFEVIPDQHNFGKILGLKTEDYLPYHELYNMSFKHMIGFDDMVKMNPTSRSNSKGHFIQLDYAPIKNEQGELEYMMIIGTDKTKEIESIEKFKKEWNFSQMIMRIVSNRFSILKIIKESFSMIDHSIQILESNTTFPVRSIQRYAHTIKGSFSYFYIQEITNIANDLESFLGPFYDQEILDENLKLKIIDKITALQVSIECYIDSFDHIIHLKNATTHKTVSISDLDDFGKDLKKLNPKLYSSFHSKFYRSEIKPYFQMYSALISDFGIKLNKKVRFVLEGGQLFLPERPWEQLFGQFIHFVRNSLDHGIESEQERLAAGKDSIGEIKFSFKTNNENLEIELCDDGRGIEWEKIAKKDHLITNESQAIQKIMMGGISSKEEVSDLSGRGVGVSSIVSMVQNWNGTVEFVNRQGQGLTLRILVPLNKNENLKTVA